MRKTLFVLGAGASKEFNLPLGIELRSHITHRLTKFIEGGDRSDDFTPLAVAIRELGEPWHELVKAANAIRKGIVFSDSIDDFLNETRDRPLIGRLAKIFIAACILNAEQQAPHFLNFTASEPNIPEAHTAFEAMRNTWIGQLFRGLRRGRLQAEAADVLKDCMFVVFNYDRCLEAYLHAALRDAFDLSSDDARRIVEAVPITHVYGSLGHPFGGVNYGDINAKLGDVAKRIKTYSEDMEDDPVAKHIRSMLDQARQIVFLGYSFHPQGMDLLPSDARLQLVRGFATGKGASNDAVNRLSNKFGAIEVMPLTCAALMEDRLTQILEDSKGISLADFVERVPHDARSED